MSGAVDTGHQAELLRFHDVAGASGTRHRTVLAMGKIPTTLLLRSKIAFKWIFPTRLAITHAARRSNGEDAMRSSSQAPAASGLILIEAGLLALLMLVSGIGPAQRFPAHAATASGRAALTCVPLDNVPFGPPIGQGLHHVTGTGVEDGPLRFYSFMPEGVFLTGQPVDIRLEVRNAGDAPITFSFTTAQRYDVVIWNDDCKELWRWSAGRMFAQVVQSTSVSGRGRVVYHIPWQQRDQAGRQVRIGGYEAQVVFLGRAPQGGAPVVLPPLTFAVR